MGFQLNINALMDYTQSTLNDKNQPKKSIFIPIETSENEKIED